MIKSIGSLFTSSLIGRIIGFVRFQILVFLFAQNLFTDYIIYTTTLIWTINNFFVIPTVNKSFIADLGSNKKEDYESIVYKTSISALKSGFFAGLIALGVVLFMRYFANGIVYSTLDLAFIFLIIISLGQNEVFSLFNQFNRKYFLYALNPAVWNTILIIGLIVIWLIGTQELAIYLLCMLLSILITIILQFKKSGISIDLLRKARPLFKLKNSVNRDYWYNGVIILFMGTTFFDLNIISVYSLAGFVTVYTIMLKLPELLMSIINGSVQPVFFNSIMEKNENLKNGILKFVSISIITFLGLGVVLFILNEPLYKYMFNFDSVEYKGNILLIVLMTFLASVSYMIIRLSEEFKYAKILFINCAILLLIKLLIILNVDFQIELIIYTNIFTYLSIILVGVMNLFSNYRKVKINMVSL